jgi:enolase
MIILNIRGKIIEDSRKNKTLEVLVEAQDKGKKVSSLASVPSGKSTGIHEAKALDPKIALEKLESLKKDILGQDFKTQKELDDFLIQKDGTLDKHNLGANLILAISLAWARNIAKIEGLQLNQYLYQLLNFKSKKESNFPRPIFNVINGGAHVSIPLEWKKKFGITKPLDIQEFQVIPTTGDFALGLSVGREFYDKLGKELLKIYGQEGLILGDEAGYVCPFKTNEEAIEIIQELINRHLYPLKIGLDVAASYLYDNVQKLYLLEGDHLTSEELRMFYFNLVEKYELVSIEDPFEQEAFDDFALFKKDLFELKPKTKSNKFEDSFLVITDDLTTTNPKRLKEAITKKAANAILIKPNQIGTLSETLEVIYQAYKNGWQTVVSHRSGETTDDFIADLAVGVGAWGLKSGSPATEFRMAKYSRALDLWQKIYSNQ